MKTHLRILSFFIVFSGVMMRSGNVYEGTEGEKLDINCPYPDKHRNTPKYFCREPCTSSKHVLMKTEKIDQLVSAGRYSVMNNVYTNTFTVTIRHLRLTDSGVYYCGLDQWFHDTLNKVKLSVYPARVIPPLITPEAAFSSTHTANDTVSRWMTTHTFTDGVTYSNDGVTYNISSASTKNNSTSSRPPIETGENIVIIGLVCAGVLVLLLFCFLVALLLLCKRRSDSKSRSLNPPSPENPVLDPPNLNQTAEDIYHLYDELRTENCLVAQPRQVDASLIYSTVQKCDSLPNDDVNSFYSLITLQQM